MGREALEQAGADAVAVQLVRDGERNLGAVRVVEPYIRRQRDRSHDTVRAGELTEQRAAVCQSVSSAPATVFGSIDVAPWKRR